MGTVMVLGRGWVGRAVLERARRDGVRVVSVDPPVDPEYAGRDRVAAEALVALARREEVTAVVNACGLTGGSAEELRDANRDFPEWVCRTLAGTGARIVHVGSASEYGDPGTDRPVAETEPPRPVGDYATSKAAGTDAVLAARSDGADAMVARVFNLVAPDLPPASPLAEWLGALRAAPSGPVEVEVWWPATVRDFVRLDDAAGSLLALATAGVVEPVVNVCSGVGLAFGDIVGALADRLGVAATVRSLDRPGIPAVVGDPGALRRLVGAAPEMSLGLLARTVLPDRSAGDHP